MPAPQIPDDETARQAALDELDVVGTPPEVFYDRCTELGAAILGVDRAAVSLIDHDRQWFKSVFGPLPPETGRDISFCGHAILRDELLVVPDASLDPRFADSPLVTDRTPPIRFYCGVPLKARDNQRIGTLCAMGSAPLHPGEDDLRRFSHLADCVQEHLDLRRLALRLAEERRELADEVERRAAEGAEASTLGAMDAHDVRGALTVIVAATTILARDPALSDEARSILEDVAAASDAAEHAIRRMLQRAMRGATSTGLRRAPTDVADLLRRMAHRMRHVAKLAGKPLEFDAEPEAIVLDADHVLVERIARNLIENALKYGAPGAPVAIRARVASERVLVRVESQGSPLDANQQERVFEFGARLESEPDSTVDGHGVGLAFCRWAAELHGGSIRVEPTPRGNAFVVALPRA